MANFEPAVTLTLQHEGGYQNYSSDKGNYNSMGQLVGTNFGISAPTYERYLGHPPTAAEMKAISKDTAIVIYQSWYWNPFNFSLLNSQAIANQLFDIGVLEGSASMAKLAQKALNAIGYKIPIDGIFGPQTRNAINTATSARMDAELNNELASLRQSSLGTALEGYATRAESYIIDLTSSIKKKTPYSS